MQTANVDLDIAYDIVTALKAALEPTWGSSNPDYRKIVDLQTHLHGQINGQDRIDQVLESFKGLFGKKHDEIVDVRGKEGTVSQHLEDAYGFVKTHIESQNINKPDWLRSILFPIAAAGAIFGGALLLKNKMFHDEPSKATPPAASQGFRR